jgi:hypothetical protein
MWSHQEMEVKEKEEEEGEIRKSNRGGKCDHYTLYAFAEVSL